MLDICIKITILNTNIHQFQYKHSSISIQIATCRAVDAFPNNRFVLARDSDPLIEHKVLALEMPPCVFALKPSF